MCSRLIRNRVSSIPFLIFIAVLLIYPALQRKIQIGLWHLWNGNTIQLQEYDIPVPMRWIAHSNGGNISLFEYGTYHTRAEFASLVIVRSKSGASKDMSLLSTLHEQWLTSQGAQIFYRRTIDFDGEKADCIVSNYSIHRLQVPSDTVVSVNCESTTALSFGFDGDKKDVDTFFSIVSQIRKHNNGTQNVQ